MTPQRPTYAYNPRPYLPSSPTVDPSRLSTASGAPLSAIGNLLSTPYDTDDSDTEDTIRTPSDKTIVDPFGDTARTTRGNKRFSQSRKMPAKYTGEAEVIAFPRPGSRNGKFPPRSDAPTPLYQTRSPQAPNRTYNPHTSPNNGRRPVPAPSYPSPTRPGLLSSTVNPAAYHPPSQAQYNPVQPSHPQARPQLHLNTHMGVRYIPDLPPPASPVSPLLARPPPSHSSPLPRFMGASAGNRDSASSGISTNDSIAGYDSMKEKNALFRGGEEELLAFSPRPRIQKIGQGQGGQGYRNTWMGNRRTQVGGEFWKRFSVMGAEGMKSAKESEWLSCHNNGWKSIKRWIIIGIIMFILCTAGIVTAVLLLTQG